MDLPYNFSWKRSSKQKLTLKIGWIHKDVCTIFRFFDSLPPLVHTFPLSVNHLLPLSVRIRLLRILETLDLQYRPFLHILSHTDTKSYKHVCVYFNPVASFCKRN